jgi:hypothetical protein
MRKAPRRRALRRVPPRSDTVSDLVTLSWAAQVLRVTVPAAQDALVKARIIPVIVQSASGRKLYLFKEQDVLSLATRRTYEPPRRGRLRVIAASQ